jgi:hypothetical protein
VIRLPMTRSQARTELAIAALDGLPVAPKGYAGRCNVDAGIHAGK